jgi:hypothetical protein
MHEYYLPAGRRAQVRGAGGDGSKDVHAIVRLIKKYVFV